VFCNLTNSILSDESTHIEAATQNVSANFSSSTLHPPPGQSLRPAGQSSRPSSRQGQKYTAVTAAAPVVVGYHDNELPSRKVIVSM